MLSPTSPASYNARMPQTSAPTTPRSYMRATAGSMTARSSISQPFSTHSYEPGQRHRAVGAVSATSYSSQDEDRPAYARRLKWNAYHSANVEHHPAWSRYGRADALNVNLEVHPFWVAKGPGTYDSTQERWNLTTLAQHPLHGRPPQMSRGWNSRFVSAHVRQPFASCPAPHLQLGLIGTPLHQAAPASLDYPPTLLHRSWTATRSTTDTGCCHLHDAGTMAASARRASSDHGGGHLLRRPRQAVRTQARCSLVS